MSIVVEREHSVLVTSFARLVDDEKELAWAEPFVKKNPSHAWLVAAFVEADRANRNGQFVSLEDLQGHHHTIANNPTNVNHDPRRVVGFWKASELLYPTQQAAAKCPTCGVDMKDGKCPQCGYEQAADDGQQHPIVETLACLWKDYFPSEYAAIRAAHVSGMLATSMEAVPEALRCAGPDGCGQEFSYVGNSTKGAYCAHLEERASWRQLVRPHYVGGATIIPPAMPGWKDAQARSLADANRSATGLDLETLAAEAAKVRPDVDMSKVEAALQATLNSLAAQHMAPSSPKAMHALAEVIWAKKFTAEQRRKMAKTGAALPSGAYPIDDAESLMDAIRLLPNGKADPAVIKSHIIKRAKALGLTKMLPEAWR